MNARETVMAHDGAMLGVRADPALIYDPPDLHYLDWLEGVLDDVHRTRLRQQAEAEAKMK